LVLIEALSKVMYFLGGKVMKRLILSSAICAILSGFAVTASAQVNLVKNPGFEAGTLDWILKTGNESISTVVQHSGTSSAFNPVGAVAEYRQNLTLVPGKVYRVSAWVKITNSVGTGWGGTRLSVVSVINGAWKTYNSTPYQNVVGDWKKLELTFTAETSTYVVQINEQGAIGREVSGYWDDIEVKEETQVVTTPANNGNYAMIFRHQYAANDHIESWMKVLAAMGIEYDFWFDANSDTVNTPISTVNRLDASVNPLLDANGKPKNAILVHGGGSGTGNSSFTSTAKTNVRDFVKVGGNFFWLVHGFMECRFRCVILRESKHLRYWLVGAKSRW
jgi:Carbohydrate binding domain